MNKAFVEVTGTKVNRDWKFHAYSQSAFIHRMKDCRLTPGKKITAGHRPKTDQKAGIAIYLLNSPDIKPTRPREYLVSCTVFFLCVCVKL